MHFLQRPAALAIAVSLLLISIGLGVTRMVGRYDVPGNDYDSSQMGLFDFHNGIYFPTQAFAAGISPYGQEILDQQYPVTRPTPIYGPSHFLIHLPLAMLPLRVAEVLYTGLNLTFLIGIAFVPLFELWRIYPSSWFGRSQVALLTATAFLSTLILLGRAGHVSFVSGYFTAELVIGTVLTLYWSRERPWLASLAFVLACGKPTYALPLLIVLLIQRQFKAFVACVVTATVVSSVATGWLVWHSSIAEIVEGIKVGQRMHMADPIEFPVQTWLRVDWTAIGAKWLDKNPDEPLQIAVMLILYGILFDVFRRKKARIAARHNESELIASEQPQDLGVTSLTAAVLLLSVVLFVYHHVYDAMLCIPIIAALWINLSEWTRKLGRSLRYVTIILVAAPFWNYISTETLLVKLPDDPVLQKALTSTNTAALSVAFFLLLTFFCFKTAKKQDLSTS